MIDFIYTTGWGAFIVMLMFQIPFLIVFFSIVNKKAFVDSTPGKTEASKYSSTKWAWVGLTIIAFIVVNVASIQYMPTVIEAGTGNAKEVTVEARSWAFDISDTNLRVGEPVRFSATSADTMHSFAIIHPDGQQIFTMMLMPGLETANTLVHTFTEPGEYIVRCLEYCGIAHHTMKTTLTVASN
ncbi:MAG: hypothetical protein GY763_14295 [Gammaproteobacteria bacterium]|nr:hypothetical protein [Gammaproteobacteria bacterium]